VSATSAGQPFSGSTTPLGATFLELQGLTKVFGDTTVVDGIDLHLVEGEFFSILGPSGCGKTTTLRMIGGFESPTEGRILLDGQNIAGLPPNRRPVNTVFQSYALFSHLDVFGNVEFGLREARVGRQERTLRTEEALALVRLEGFEHRRPRQLSGGQQQRVALARALVNRPRLLLLDEPLGALDLKLRRAMQFELKGIQQQLGTTFIYVTHDQEEALTMSNRIALMRDGRIEQVGSPEEIYDRPANGYVADFIGNANSVAVRVQSLAGDVAEVAAAGLHACGVAHPALVEGVGGRLVVRPERCRLTEAAVGACFSGTVREVVFLGLHRAVVVVGDDGQTMTAYVPHMPSEPSPPPTGVRIGVSWDARDAWVVPETEHDG
jgi:ABC-type Fe3+/spermidine/putrescine transport system ATPase subunit